MYLPEGFNTITPYFIVDDANVFIDFLKNAFDGVEVGRTEMDRRIPNAQIRIGTSTIMLGESNENTAATTGSYYLYVENAGESMKRALDSGGELVMDVTDMPYGDRQGGVKDPCGNIWWVSQRLVGEPYH